MFGVIEKVRINHKAHKGGSKVVKSKYYK